MGQNLVEVDSSWLVWFVRIFVALCFSVGMVSSINGPSLVSANETGRWKAQFFYVSPLHACTVEVDDNSTSHQSEPEFLELNKALRKYREASQGIIRRLSLSHEVALRTEQLLMSMSQNDLDEVSYETRSSRLLSRQIEQKISKVAELLEQNAFVLEGLLKSFPVIMGLSRFTNVDVRSSATLDCTRMPSIPVDGADSLLERSKAIPPLARYIPPYKPRNDSTNGLETDEQPYEDAAQIIAHITRDWTAGGAPIREMTYKWIVDQLWNYHRETNDTSICSPVLVPGAGMGRLAYDIAFSHERVNTQRDAPENNTILHRFPFEVEAADSSVVMASAAHHILNLGTDQQHEIYPFVNDPFTNEVDTEKRWRSMLFPENTVLRALKHLNSQPHEIFVNEPSLSYTIGDFVTTYASNAKQGMYGSIATCYFIDTATNIHEYILTIKNLLRRGGLWINLGPVQWHRNAQLQPSVNELRQMIELFGFQIHHWEVEDRLVGYRHPDDIEPASRFTRSEGYRPLKFVASYGGTDETVDLLPLFEKLRLSTGRRSMFHNVISEEDS